MIEFTLDNGRLALNSEPVDINGLVFGSKLSRGANGIIFEAFDPHLERKVAVKFWTQLRERDDRDKLKQGLAEARKAWKARRDEVVEIYLTGVVHDTVFTVMELLPGVTLKQWLASAAGSYGMRWGIAEKLVQLDHDFQKDGLTHGDLHWKNVMVADDESPRGYFELGRRPPLLKILDFGTSYYCRKSGDTERHYRVLCETIDRCIAPFRLDRIEADVRPCDSDPQAMGMWLFRSLYAIRAALFTRGLEFVGWPLYVNPYRGFTTDHHGIALKSTLSLLDGFFSAGSMKGDPEFLGEGREWGPFDGRYQKNPND